MNTKTETNHTPTLKKGMIVNVYSDPITKKNPEGKAILEFHENVADNDHLQYWSIRFKGHESDGYFLRWIDPSDITRAEGKNE